MDPQSREGPGGTADVSAEPHAWPHEIFDLLALAAAFFAAVAVQPLLAFRASDYAAADADSFATTPSSGPTAISAGVALWSSLCSVLTTLSLIAAVLGRSLSTVEERMVGARRALLHRLMQPFVVLATVPLAISVIVFPNALYYSGFAMFRTPSPITRGGSGPASSSRSLPLRPWSTRRALAYTSGSLTSGAAPSCCGAATLRHRLPA